MAETSYYSEEELQNLGLKRYGIDIRLSRKASIYSPSNITLGNHIRIDDFCILSGSINVGDYVHINPYTGIFAGKAGVYLSDYVNLASRVTIYAVSDDYSGEYMTSPLIPSQYTNIKNAPVFIGKHTIIGTGTSILPGVTIGEGCAIGAMSMVKHNLKEWTIWAGVPCREIRRRSKKLLELVRDEY